MKKKFVIAFIFISLAGYSQGFLSSQGIQVDFSGFIRNDFIFDERKNLCYCDQLLEMFPLKPDYGADGKDLNAQSSAKFLNIFTRFGTRFSGLEMIGAKVGGYVEVDFTGGAATNSLRLRHVYTQFEWAKSKLLVGRTWHPTFIEKVYPSTLNENTGLPFQVFNRSPQIRFTYKLSKHLDVITAAVYQFKYANLGPDGRSYIYQRNAVAPNLHLQLQFYNDNWVVGTAIDWKSIQPRTYTNGDFINYDNRYKTNQKLNTLAAIAYLKYSKGKFLFKAKSMFGQNVSESLLPGGYAVASIDSVTGAETYTPTNHLYNWVNFVYGSKFKMGMFIGYLKNMGTTENPVGSFYATAPDIDIIYKISPQFIYTYKNFMFGWELSWTTAAYGDIDYMDKGKVKNTENVTNFRNMISIAYKF